MYYFFDQVIGPYIKQQGYEEICEIGSSHGGCTDKLARLPCCRLCVIDPCVDEDLVKKYEGSSLRVCKGLSLDVLHGMRQQFDCILLDGDHNWYTVFNELKTIHEGNLLRDGGSILLHDVLPPWGRRDMYYFPESIPAVFRHEYRNRNGSNAAVDEGGARNGVLTAVEDFVRENVQRYRFLILNEQHGLGILIKRGRFSRDVVFSAWVALCRAREMRKRAANYCRLRNHPRIMRLLRGRDN